MPPTDYPAGDRDSESISQKHQRESIVNYGLSILNFVAERNGLGLSKDAYDVFAQSLRDNSDDPLRQIFETRRPGAMRRFGYGVEQVAELTAFLALKKKEDSISAPDVLEAIRRNFCSCWPFCRKRP